MISNIQALRALAALLIVAYHAADRLPWSHFRAWADSGVDIFFVISGFLMAYTTRIKSTPMDFMKGRLVRIVPMYWIATIFTFMMVSIFPNLFHSTKNNPVWLAKSLAFIPFNKSGITSPILFVGWTLNYEMFFYVTFSISMMFGRYRIFLLTVALLLISALHPYMSSTIGRFYTDPIILQFSAGAIIAYLPKQLNPKIAIVIIAAGFCALIITGGFPVQRGLLRLLPAALIVYGTILLDRSNYKVSQPLVLLLGNASYSIYLFHPFVSQVGGFAIGKFPREYGLPIAILTFLCGAAVGTIIYLFAEKPITKFLRSHNTARPN